MASIPTEKTSGLCSTIGCRDKVRARGFCIACYYRKLRHGDIIPKTQTLIFKHRLSSINEVERTAICSHCGPVGIYKRTRMKGVKQQQWRCKKHQDEKSRLYKQAYRESRKVMLGPECEICGSHKKLCWDHSHKTNKFRGTLCSRCNTGIGLFEENSNFFRKAIAYLWRNKT
jgi:hypothetical protein